MKQDIEVPMRLPTPQLNANHFARSTRVKKQRRAVRAALETLAVRPTLPIEVTLVRISSGTPDSDRAMASLTAVRDEVARWACGVPFEDVRIVDGKLQRYTPRAPDGPSDPITWIYGQQRTRKRGYQAARIIITETTTGDEQCESRQTRN